MGAGLLAGAWCEDFQVQYKPPAFGGFSEFGLMRSGQYGQFDFKNEWVDHFGAYAAWTVLPAENLAFDIGLGGVFEYQKREVITSQWGGTQYKNFFTGPSVADIRYGSLAGDGQGFGLQFGMFDYKYNPDASNLGEYLFRSGAYPGYVTSGGLWFVNRSLVQLEALRAGYGSGGFAADVFLVTETSMPSLYDLSAAALASYRTAGGLFEVGAGFNYKHLVPVKPSLTTRHHPTNAYFKKDGKAYSANDALYLESSNFYRRRAAEDPANAAAYNARADADKAVADSVFAWVANPAASGIQLHYFTQTGLIAMVRASIDFKKLFGSESLGEKDLRLYAEAAVLGIKDYPVFYENIAERIPVMAGLNLPTFGLLDLLSLEVEYYKSPYLNSYASLVEYNAAVPQHVLGSDKVRSGTEYADITGKDDFSWSILAKKNVLGSAYVALQVARDHIRTVSIETWTAPEPTQVLGRSSDWYWMLQFGFGI
jgi:hypothetical protein